MKNEKRILKEIRKLDKEELKYMALAGFGLVKQMELEHAAEDAKINENFELRKGAKNRTSEEIECALNLQYISKWKQEKADEFLKKYAETSINEIDTKLVYADLARDFGEEAKEYAKRAAEVIQNGFQPQA